HRRRSGPHEDARGHARSVLGPAAPAAGPAIGGPRSRPGRRPRRADRRGLPGVTDEAPPNFRKQQRYAPTVERVYANDAIEVTWEPAFCIHAADCLRGLPDVFDPMRRPWIEVDRASPDQIAEVVQRCPTGALHFRRLDGGPQEPEPEETTIQE